MKVIEQKSIEFLKENFDLKIPSDTIGIDMGQTLTKIAYIKPSKAVKIPKILINRTGT